MGLDVDSPGHGETGMKQVEHHMKPGRRRAWKGWNLQQNFYGPQDMEIDG